ncbi:MAG: SGNH/GDSL hydrolase family protein [Propionibacteriaceae bacterium]|nr:SGNH/GDSL hydrolase family protein [Propionibacteriaceae bacterium]
MKHRLLALLATLAMVATSAVALAPHAYADTGGGATYVSVGDSFAAGTGVPPYASGADAACLRSQTSGYPALLSQWPTFRNRSDVTCSGKTTADIAAQLEIADIGPNTRSVTVTVGGNDVGWSDALMVCMVNQQACSGAFADVAAKIPAVKTSIAGVIGQVAAVAPNANVYVTGYPYLFGDFKGTCTVGTGPTGAPIVVDRTAATTVNAAVIGLNVAIAAGVKKSGDRDATYVDVSFLSLRHGLCGSGSDWINGVQFSGPYPLPSSLHPNLAGERSYASRVLVTSWFK